MTTPKATLTDLNKTLETGDVQPARDELVKLAATANAAIAMIDAGLMVYDPSYKHILGDFDFTVGDFGVKRISNKLTPAPQQGQCICTSNNRTVT